MITGSTDGIGKEFAIQLAKKGFNIILMARNQEKLDTTKAQIQKESKGISVESIKYDFSQSPMLGKLEDLIRSALKDKRVGVLVNNVGMSHDHPEYFEETQIKSLEDMINVNVTNTLTLTRLLLPSMLDQRSGLILNIGSFSGEAPIPLLQTYSGAKAFLKTWSLALSAEVAARGVDVQLLNTYFVVSNMSKFKRPTTLIPTPQTYVAAALKQAGRTAFVTPVMPHAWLHLLMSWVPAPLLMNLNRSQMKATRQKALGKLSKKA